MPTPSKRRSNNLSGHGYHSSRAGPLRQLPRARSAVGFFSSNPVPGKRELKVAGRLGYVTGKRNGGSEDVCEPEWRAPRSSTVTLANPHDNDVRVYDASVATCPWPFSLPHEPFTIKAHDAEQVVLKAQPGRHCYRTKGCPDDVGVNPKTVIIT
jgi:hypothetical protein